MPYVVERDKNSRIIRTRTPKHLWHRLRDFSKEATSMPAMALNLLRFVAWVHEGHCFIPDKNKSGKMSPMVMNRGQIMIMDAMLEQAMEGKPVRLIIPKSRRQGVSTLITMLFRFLCDHLEDRNARLVAHSDSSAKEIFDIVRKCHSRVLWHTKKKKVSYSDISVKGIKFDETNSEFTCMTAQGRHSASGAKTDYLEISELAKLDKTSNQDTKALDSLLPTVTDGDPNTIIVIESTGQGSVGEFYRRTMAALNRDGDADETQSSYKCVFLSWLIDKMCEAKTGFPETHDGFKKKLAGYELTLRDTHKATPAQIQWRREKLRDRGIRDYSENPVNFSLEFPLICDDCFKTQAGRIYPMLNPEFPKMQELPDSYFSSYATHTRAIDWGSSAESPFVCLWLVFDPDKPAALVTSPTCTNLWEEYQNYVRDPISGKPMKQFDHGCFDGGTEFLIRNKGWTPINELVGTEGEVWTPAGWRPYWNVHKTGNLPTIETVFNDGFSVITTPDHKAWDGDDFVDMEYLNGSNVPSLKGGRYEDKRPDCFRRKQTGVSGENLQETQKAKVLHKRAERPAPSCLVGAQRGSAEGASCSSRGRRSVEQFDWESSLNDGVGPSRAPRQSTKEPREAAREHASLRKASGVKMARVARRHQAPQEDWKIVLEEAGDSHAELRNMWSGISNQRHEEGNEVLSFELQDGSAPSEAWYQTASKTPKLQSLWDRVSSAEGIRVLRRDMCNGIPAESLKRVAVHSQKPAGVREVFDLTIDNANCATLSNGCVFAQCDALRYAISTLKPRGLVYVRKELFIRDFGLNNDPQSIARRVHQESGYFHPSGDPENSDVSKYQKGPGAFAYTTGVADRARNDLINMFNIWGINLMGYRSPHERDTGQGIVEDGIALVQALAAGNVVFTPDVIDPEVKKATEAIAKLSGRTSPDGRPVMPTDDEFDALERRRGNRHGRTMSDPDMSPVRWGW